ncbi:MAG: mannitol-1-phosphate 5-dehydrogenase [Spirochaetales bacterium]|uniref:Mannitol-1-phosphate 5-dehydrogenase n=1 Tax=Candidatus Thalassospirochaeta sargassi TaxID=3119039 RepID=A0AAJ1IF95_9SPIO|nr:mannitol-1-phosphate 5-dehydrogenase [Spirochaetales bacterium]
MKTAVHFGAGNIGRGFIGSLLSASGYHVTFADISKTIIPELNARGEYIVEIVGEEKREMKVSPVSGIYSNEPKLAKIIAEAEIVTTAVGPGVLPHIAAPIARGITARKEAGNEKPLNIIACENMIGGSSKLKAEVLTHVKADVRSFVEKNVGFPNSAVDRIVPPMEETEELLRVRVEEFSEWIVEKDSFIGEVPKIEGMHATADLMKYVERKLFTLNTGHAITAYLGALQGHRTIAESISDPQILPVVRGAMNESGEVLILRYGFDRVAHTAYIEKILERFRNPWLKDEVDRVGRQPLRKLGADDRLIKPLRGAIEYGTSYRNLVVGIAAALYFRNDEDDQAEKLEGLLASLDVKSAIPEITSLVDDDIIKAIEEAYEIRGIEDLHRDFVSNWTRIVSAMEAEQHFPELLKEALSGREIIVAKSGIPLVRITAVAPAPPNYQAGF